MVLLGEGRGGRFTDNGDGTLTYHPERRGTDSACRVPPRRAVSRQTRLRAARQRAGPTAVFHPRPRSRALGGGRPARSTSAATLAVDRQGTDRGPLPPAVHRPIRSGHLVPWPDSSRFWRRTRSPADAFAERGRACGARSGRTASTSRRSTGRWPAVLRTRRAISPTVVVDHIRADLRRRADPYFSPDAAVFDALLTVYGVLAIALTTGMISAADRVRFVEGQFHGFFSFLASGPPPRRLAELLALHDAGLVRFRRARSPGRRHRRRRFVGSARRPSRGGSGPGPWSMPGCPDPMSRRPPTRSSAACWPHGELAAEELTGPDGRPLAGWPAARRCGLPGHPRRPLRPPPPVPAGPIGVRLRRVGRFLPARFQRRRFPAERRCRPADPAAAAGFRPPSHRTTSTYAAPIEGAPPCPLSSWESPAPTRPARSPRAPGGSLDLDYTQRLARAHEDNGWDRILFAYHSGSPDPAQVAAYVAGQHRADQPGARAPAQCLGADLRRQDLRHPGPHLRRPVRGALHHRRFHRRPGRRG